MVAGHPESLWPLTAEPQAKAGPFDKWRCEGSGLGGPRRRSGTNRILMGAVQRQVTVRGGVGASMGTFLALLGAFGGNAMPVSAEVYSYRDRLGVVHFTNAPTDQRF